MTAERPQHTWRDERDDLMRGIGGAAIIGLPLLYTMEMWRLATMLSPASVFVIAMCALLVNTGYNLASGFRRGGTLIDSAFDAVEAYALGALFALVALVLLNIVGSDLPLIDVASKVAIEAIPLSFGISIANTQFAGTGTEGEDTDGERSNVEDRHPALANAGITVAGAILFAFNVAPTEEVILIATRMTWIHLLMLVPFSLSLAYGMIYIAEFRGYHARRREPDFLQSPFGNTIIGYVLSLGVALAMVGAFHGVDVMASPYTTVATAVVLGLPATIGGAAGRLLI